MIIFIEDFFTYGTNLKCCLWVHVTGWGFSIGLPGAFIGATSFYTQALNTVCVLGALDIVIQSITLLFFSKKNLKTEKKVIVNISLCLLYIELLSFIKNYHKKKVSYNCASV